MGMRAWVPFSRLSRAIPETESSGAGAVDHRGLRRRRRDPGNRKAILLQGISGEAEAFAAYRLNDDPVKILVLAIFVSR